MEHEGSTFLSGAAGSVGFFFFAKELDVLAAADTPNSSFFVYDEDDEDPFRKYDENVSWPAISMATIKPAGQQRLVVAVGPNGNLWELNPSSTVETVGSMAVGHANIRRLAAVGDEVFACGMNRVVFRRSGPARWVPMGPGALPGDPPVVGFEDLGGPSADELYAVGWGGEVWWCDAGTWKRVDSPTNANLNALCVGAGQTMYAVGQDGTMLRGRHDQWHLVQTGTRANLQDVAEFGGTVFAVTDFHILRLDPTGLVPEGDFSDPDDLPATCLHLLESSDGLISLGQKDVYVKRDGPWERLV